MKFVAKVFKNGNSLAVRLPAALKVSAKELVIQPLADGQLLLCDEKAQERAYKRRRRDFEKLLETATHEEVA